MPLVAVGQKQRWGEGGKSPTYRNEPQYTSPCAKQITRTCIDAWLVLYCPWCLTQ